MRFVRPLTEGPGRKEESEREREISGVKVTWRQTACGRSGGGEERARERQD
jgi:hypothetical protein